MKHKMYVCMCCFFVYTCICIYICDDYAYIHVFLYSSVHLPMEGTIINNPYLILGAWTTRKPLRNTWRCIRSFSPS